MRLTLRALLAYMDDILEPADQEEVGRKIEASPFATELIHRSSDAMRRLRLSAPDPVAGDSGDLHGSDSHLDANAMAEYLDHALEPEEVPQFERNCLEASADSDMLLAEARACHHILTMVLGEPADVDADMRQRMYELATKVPPAAAVAPAAPAPASPANLAAAIPATPSSPEGKLSPPHALTPLPSLTPAHAVETVTYVASPELPPARMRSEVPDYLRAAAQARRRSRLWGFGVAAALLGGVVAAVALRTPEPKLPSEVASGAMGDVDDLTAGPVIGGEGTFAAPPTRESTATDEAPAADAAPTSETTAANEALPPAAAAPASSLPTTTEQAATPPAEAPSAAATPQLPPELPPALADAADGPALVTASPVEQESGASVADSIPDPEASLVTPGPSTLESALADTTLPVDDDAATSAAASVTLGPSPQSEVGAPPSGAADDQPPAEPSSIPGADVASAGDADAATQPPMAESADAEEPPPPPGQYLGANDLLLRHGGDGWVRLPPRTPLQWSDKLAVLPTFRSFFVLRDANVYAAGGTLVELVEPQAGGGLPPADFALAIPVGRAIINSGLEGNRVEIVSGEFRRAIRLGPSSSLAVEVTRPFVPGQAADPAAEPVVSWYLSSGSAQWGEGIEPVQAEAMSGWRSAPGDVELPQSIDELPAWIDREPATALEQRARDAVATTMAPGDPASVRLLELADPTNLGKRREVRALAAVSGALVGQYEPIVRALRDADQRALWKDQIAALRAALARDPAAAEGIRAALAHIEGEASVDDLMEMLIGFDQAAVGRTRDEVGQGALVRLIRWLESDDLIYRVLALHNIQEITGTGNLGGYRPEQTAAQRARIVERYYWQRLENGELTPR